MERKLTIFDWNEWMVQCIIRLDLDLRIQDGSLLFHTLNAIVLNAMSTRHGDLSTLAHALQSTQRAYSVLSFIYIFIHWVFQSDRFLLIFFSCYCTRDTSHFSSSQKKTSFHSTSILTTTMMHFSYIVLELQVCSVMRSLLHFSLHKTQLCCDWRAKNENEKQWMDR